jgi:hypothetical protein
VILLNIHPPPKKLLQQIKDEYPSAILAQDAFIRFDKAASAVA